MNDAKTVNLLAEEIHSTVNNLWGGEDLDCLTGESESRTDFAIDLLSTIIENRPELSESMYQAIALIVEASEKALELFEKDFAEDEDDEEEDEEEDRTKYPDIDLAIHGATYAERKEDLRQKAITWQASEYQFSYGELAQWNEYFRENGKRYGLLEEFRENAII